MGQVVINCWSIGGCDDFSGKNGNGPSKMRILDAKNGD